MGLTRPQVHLLLALCTGVLIGLVMPNALSQRRTFIPPVAPRAVPTFAPTLAPSTSTPSPGPIKSALDALSHVREAEHLAEFVYKNQASLERGQRVNPLIASYEAEYPCMWGEYATGLAKTWREEWGTYMDGWKFTCGLPLITQPCVVYSLGSCGNMAFEAAVLQTLPECEIHVFDKDNFGLEKWFPDAAARSHVKFHRYFIASVDNLNANPPQRTLASIMAELGHTHLDILKADIEVSYFVCVRICSRTSTGRRGGPYERVASKHRTAAAGGAFGCGARRGNDLQEHIRLGRGVRIAFVSQGSECALRRQLRRIGVYSS